MTESFVKMQALGNDFVLLDHIDHHLPLSSQRIRQLADRRLGVGCDQVLVIKQADHPSAQFAYAIFNADGSQVEQCGNGVRCIAKYLCDTHRIAHNQKVSLHCLAGLIDVTVLDNNDVNVDMGLPNFEPEKIGLIEETKARDYAIKVGQNTYRFGAVSLGNPHAVTRVDQINLNELSQVGLQLNRSECFTQGVNVGFMRCKSSHEIQLAVYERGVGLTQACGSGACAAVVIGRLWGILDECVAVNLPGGCLQIRWSGDPGSSVFMQGAAMTVFSGRISVN